MPNYIEFREKQLKFCYNYLDDNTFCLDFGDGELSDEDGKFFVHCEKHLDNGEFVFELWYEDSVVVDNNIFLTLEEKTQLMQFIENILKKEMV